MEWWRALLAFGAFAFLAGAGVYVIMATRIPRPYRPIPPDQWDKHPPV